MVNPFKWFNDLIERSTFWYYVYFFSLNIICDKFFYSLSDQAFYTFTTIFMVSFSYLAWKTVFKKLNLHLKKYYYLYKLLFSIIFIIIIPFSSLYFLSSHPLLGTWIYILIALTGCYTFAIIDHFQNKKQA